MDLVEDSRLKVSNHNKGIDNKQQAQSMIAQFSKLQYFTNNSNSGNSRSIVKFNYQQKQENYIDNQLQNKTKRQSGFIINHKNRYLQGNKQFIIKKKASQNLINTEKKDVIYSQVLEINRKMLNIQTQKINYQKLSKQIKLKPLLQMLNQSDTIQKIPQYSTQSYNKYQYQNTMRNKKWIHSSEQSGHQKLAKRRKSSFALHSQKIDELLSSRKISKVLNKSYNFNKFDGIEKIHFDQIKLNKMSNKGDILNIQIQKQSMAQNIIDQAKNKNGQSQPQKPRLTEDKIVDDKNNQKNQQKNQLKKKQMQQILEKNQQQIFDVKTYINVYFALKTIQRNLKNVNLLIGIKNYLQLIASGRIDNYQYIKNPVNKKKIIKSSLLFQRISIIIISFAYASNTLNQSFKFVSILVKYIFSNYLIILKILSTHQQIQIDNQLKQIWSLSNKQFQNKGFQTLKQNNIIILENIYKISKYNTIFYQNIQKFIKNSHQFTIQQSFYFILQYFSFFLNICGFQHKIPFLAVAPNPYLPQIQPNKYTLIIDLIQVLWNAKKNEFRPYSEYFLSQMAQYYQIVVFSIAFPNQINKLIELLDKRKKIKYRLYKHHSIKVNGIYLKDLSRLGRNLQKTILIDSQNELNQPNKQNSIYVKKWTGNNKDTCLAELCPILGMIVIKNMNATQAVQRFKDQMMRNMKNGVKYINYGLNLQQ